MQEEKTEKENNKDGSVLEGGEAIPHRHLSAADLSGQGSALHCRCTGAERAREETAPAQEQTTNAEKRYRKKGTDEAPIKGAGKEARKESAEDPKGQEHMETEEAHNKKLEWSTKRKCRN